MIEIELPCCDTPALIDDQAETVRCESCGLELDVEPAPPTALPLAA